MLPTQDPETKTKELVSQIVDNYWEKHNKAYMLSALGFDLKTKLPESKQVLSDGLREFLRQNVIVQVVQFPGVAQKIGTVPLGVDLPEDISTLFEPRKTHASALSSPIYKQAFWDAFIQDINEGKIRVVSPKPDGTLSIFDTPQDEFTEQDGSYTIETKDLTNTPTGETGFEKFAATREKISEWLTAKGLAKDIFLDTRTQRNSKSYGDRVSLLLSAFDGLPKTDLARINIPLDILSKLISKN